MLGRSISSRSMFKKSTFERSTFNRRPVNEWREIYVPEWILLRYLGLVEDQSSNFNSELTFWGGVISTNSLIGCSLFIYAYSIPNVKWTPSNQTKVFFQLPLKFSETRKKLSIRKMVSIYICMYVLSFQQNCFFGGTKLKKGISSPTDSWMVGCSWIKVNCNWISWW
jgi:hypothetical protein